MVDLDADDMHDTLTIRKATLADASYIATYLLLAMEDIVYLFIGDRDYDKAYSFLLHFVERENNQYAYQNCWVAEDEDGICAAVNIYDGADLVSLREPIVAFVRGKYNKDFNPEDETQPGEHYIDTIGVDATKQGQGIGSRLLDFLITEYVHKQHHTLGLLVDDDNPAAQKLYLKLGFKEVGRKTLVGKSLAHLQYRK